MSRSDESDVTQPSPAAPDVFAGLDEAAASSGAALAGQPPGEFAPEAPEEAKKPRRGRSERKERGPRAEGGESWLGKLQQASPYNVMLAVSLAMMVIATACLVLELWRYGFSISATP